MSFKSLLRYFSCDGGGIGTNKNLYNNKVIYIYIYSIFSILTCPKCVRKASHFVSVCPNIFVAFNFEVQFVPICFLFTWLVFSTIKLLCLAQQLYCYLVATNLLPPIFVDCMYCSVVVVLGIVIIFEPKQFFEHELCFDEVFQDGVEII